MVRAALTTLGAEHALEAYSHAEQLRSLLLVAGVERSVVDLVDRIADEAAAAFTDLEDLQTELDAFLVLEAVDPVAECAHASPPSRAGQDIAAAREALSVARAAKVLGGDPS